MIYIIIVMVLFTIELFIKNHIDKTKEIGKKQTIIKDELYIEYTQNKGAFYSLFEDKPKVVCGISTILSGIMGIIYGVLLSKKGNVILKIGMSILMAGALSNVYDRIKRKYVVDYLYLKRLKKIVFNLADVFIVLGSFIVSIVEIFKD